MIIYQRGSYVSNHRPCRPLSQPENRVKKNEKQKNVCALKKQIRIFEVNVHFPDKELRNWPKIQK